ncbi:MAG: hypothetical protein AB7G37_01785 [Solirubrobacteraceae bacterium]
MTDVPRLTPEGLLARLTGPVAPEISCERCFDELDRYVELELAGRDAESVVPGMRAHLVGCPACAEDHASLRAFLDEGPADAGG